MPPLFAPGLTFVSATAEDGLIAGEFPKAERTVVIASGQNLTRGAALGEITASGKFILSLSAAADGSQVIRAILLDDCNASAADQRALVAFTGEFNPAKVVFGTGHTSASTDQACRDRGIFWKATVPA
jgi:hypothetical protein